MTDLVQIHDLPAASSVAGTDVLPVDQAGVTRHATVAQVAAVATAGLGSAAYADATSFATLDGGGKVPASQLPSYVDDVLEFATTSAFPASGETGKIYVAVVGNKTFRWSGSAYVEISASPGSTDAVSEGETNLYFTTARAAAAAPVQTVAGKSGTVTLSVVDVSGAAPLASPFLTGSATIKNSVNSALAYQLLLMNSGAGSNTAAIGFQVSYDGVETTGSLPKAAIAFERVAANGGGAFRIYNRNLTDTSAYSVTDCFLEHISDVLTIKPKAGTAFMGTRGEGNPLVTLSGSTTSCVVYEATGTGASVAATAITVAKNSVTDRSVNAAGTVNATGLDYAEYMEKSDGCDTLAKGQLVGVDGDGRLTDRFDDAHSFVVKSTSPSYVGGDILTEAAVGPKPEEPKRDPSESDADHATRVMTWRTDLAAWSARVEARRERYDRIAFCGQVPVALSGAWTVGDYVLAERAVDGGIAAVAVAAATLDVDGYRRSVGRIWRRDGDGRPVIAVKVV